MDFKIGDNIRVVPYDELPAERKNKGIARACDKEGVIIDKLYSGKENRYVYKVQLHTCNEPSSINFTDDMLTLSGGGNALKIKVVIEADGVAVEMYRGETKLKRAFGRLLYDGEYGVAQAASWAAKMLMQAFDERSDDGY